VKAIHYNHGIGDILRILGYYDRRPPHDVLRGVEALWMEEMWAQIQESGLQRNIVVAWC
jgi:hypothetical protein